MLSNELENSKLLKFHTDRISQTGAVRRAVNKGDEVEDYSNQHRRNKKHSPRKNPDHPETGEDWVTLGAEPEEPMPTSYEPPVKRNVPGTPPSKKQSGDDKEDFVVRLSRNDPESP